MGTKWKRVILYTPMSLAEKSSTSTTTSTITTTLCMIMSLNNLIFSSYLMLCNIILCIISTQKYFWCARTPELNVF